MESRKMPGTTMARMVSRRLCCVVKSGSIRRLRWCVDPNPRIQQARHDHHGRIKDGGGAVGVLADYRSREGDEGDPHQEENVEQEQIGVIAPYEAELAVMPHPEDADHQKADGKAQVLGPDRHQGKKKLIVGEQFLGGGEADLQSQQRDGNGKDGVAEKDRPLPRPRCSCSREAEFSLARVDLGDFPAI